MSDVDLKGLCAHGKAYAGLEPEDEAVLAAEGEKLLPYLGQITEKFYDELQSIPAARPFLEGRLDALKQTH